MKYVGIDVTHSGLTRRMIIAFPNDLIHLFVGTVMKAACEEQWPEADVKIATAGDIDLEVHETSGKSESLKLASEEGDARLLEASDYSLHIL